MQGVVNPPIQNKTDENRTKLTRNGSSYIHLVHVKGGVHNATLNNALRCVIFTSTLVETQHDARIDSDPILAFPYIAFLRLVVKKSPTF